MIRDMIGKEAKRYTVRYAIRHAMCQEKSKGRRDPQEKTVIVSIVRKQRYTVHCTVSTSHSKEDLTKHVTQ